MLDFIINNIATILLSLGLLTLFILAILKVRKDKKKSPCSSCSSCGGMCTGCHDSGNSKPH